MAYENSTIEDWECHLDSAGRKRYYYKGNHVAVKLVPDNILNDVVCLSASVKSKKVSRKSVRKIVENINTYFSVLPKELRQLLFTYVDDKQYDMICSLREFKSICDDDQSWKLLYKERYRSISEDMKLVGDAKTWRDYYKVESNLYRNRMNTVRHFLSSTGEINPTQPTLNKADALYVASHFWDKKLYYYVGIFNDIFILYYLLNIAALNGNVDLIEKIINKLAGQKTSWIDMYDTLTSTNTELGTELYKTYGDNVNEFYGNMTPLDAAVHYNQQKTVHWLLNHLPQTTNNEILNKIIGDAFLTAINAHSVYKNDDLIAYFLKNYPNVRYNVNRALAIAADNGDLEMIKFLIDDLGANVHTKNDYVLKSLAHKPNIELAQYLITKGVNLHLNDDELFIKSVHYYDTNKNLPFIKFLLDNGANIHVDNALSYATLHDSVALLNLLFKYGANPNANNGRILKDRLFNAVFNRKKYKKIIEILLENGADPKLLTVAERKDLKRLMAE